MFSYIKKVYLPQSKSFYLEIRSFFKVKMMRKMKIPILSLYLKWN